MSVTDLKNKLLEVVRFVQRGESVEITKDGEPVALLSPRGLWNHGVTGFSRIKVKGELDLPPQDWTYDVENLKPKGKPKR